MTIPTLTWTSTVPRVVSVAGANSTVAELLAAANTAISTDSIWWQVSDYNAGNGTLEIKRRTTTSPTGEAATVRYLLFGGQVPHANSCMPSTTVNNTGLYIAGSVTANTTGPSASYTAGAAYAATYIPGMRITTGDLLATGNSPRISLVESEDGLAIWWGSTSTVCSVIMGKLLIDAANSATDVVRWCHLPSGPNANSQISGIHQIDGTSGNTVIPAHYMSASTPRGGHWNGSAARSTGRLIAGMTGASVNTVWGANGAPAMFLPLPMGDSPTTSAATVLFYGFLRQIRFGPAAQHRETLRLAGVEKGIHFGPPLNLTGFGAWFDQTA